MFYDLCIPFQEEVGKLSNILKRARYLGYSIVAIEHVVKEKLTQNHVNPVLKVLDKMKKLDEECENNEEKLLDFDEEKEKEEKEPPSKKAKGQKAINIKHNKNDNMIMGLNVLTRLTVIMDSASDSKGLNNTPSAVNQYDIISVHVNGDEKLLNTVLNNIDVDLVFLNLNTKMPYFVKHSTVQIAIEKNIFFEVRYGDAIKDIECRKFLFSNGTTLARALKARNLIFTSSADKAINLRSPYDVSNLGNLLGLNQDVAKKMVGENVRKLLIKADVRKNTIKGVVRLAEK